MNYQDKIDNIDAVCFFPKDFEGARRFFEEVWEFTPKRIQPPVEETGYTTNFVEYVFRGATVAIWDRKEVTEIMGEAAIGEGHSYMTAVKLPSVQDVDAVYEEFMGKGVRCISKPHTYNFGSRAAYFLDFEGNVWEFFAWSEGGDGPALVGQAQAE